MARVLPVKWSFPFSCLRIQNRANGRWCVRTLYNVLNLSIHFFLIITNLESWLDWQRTSAYEHMTASWSLLPPWMRKIGVGRATLPDGEASNRAPHTRNCAGREDLPDLRGSGDAG
jgi:hypothetical protein